MSDDEAPQSPAPPTMADIVANATKSKYDIPLVFLQETEVFGDRTPTNAEWIQHVEIYKAIGKTIDSSHIKGLQRIRGLWRIYLDNLTDKVKLMALGVPLRGKRIPVLNTNPNRLDGENTTRVRIKNLPLSVDDGAIIRTLTLMDIEVISHYRERLRVDNKLTNCETGDRLVIVKTTTLKEPLPYFMNFGKHSGRVLHYGQQKNKTKTCSKCLEDGHVYSNCPNDWLCTDCKRSGHKKADCPGEDADGADQDGEDSESDGESPNQGTTSTRNSDTETEPETEPEKVKTGSSVDTSKKTTMASGLSQSSIDAYLTPNKERQKSSLQRSPPTPAEDLRDKENALNADKKAKKQKKK